ncbi:enoyl-CoA hydratase/isomerase family protein [Vibrio sp. 404]|uniref:3-hydroxyisobutyryl-CoA hydrolase n=1 Tax=Vibrio marinisediminis TaxID=2758441 RepID=A0A7W2FS25_9VIBR|nr:enoyl-CoA hydratase/isomerase family protein [Vibrio marinisediminis]MBA5763172.1 enoyl-CoA hydratase/isomerase family protein [Vibrio marinisediminis]
MTGKVNISQMTCADGSSIGVLELDNQSALNALNYEMIEQLYEQLLKWQSDDNIVAVFLHAAGEKAFCAGGDIQAIFRALENKEQDFDTAFKAMDSFFTLEYRCDYLIHTYSKPIVAWGHGYLMGGGVGLFMGASHRVASTNTRFAMPESKIGLYPDVGGTYFLSHLPQHFALFIALTACQVNATDMKALGLCQWTAAADDKQNFLEQLSNVEWSQHSDIERVLSEMLDHVQVSTSDDGLLMAHAVEVEALCQGSLPQIVNAINTASVDDKWFSNAQKSLRYASPLSLQICYQQLTKYPDLALKECFEMEFSLTLRCGLEGDFREGVRALIIDKTNQPNWIYQDVSQVTPQVIERFFSPIDSKLYPLQRTDIQAATL